MVGTNIITNIKHDNSIVYGDYKMNEIYMYHKLIWCLRMVSHNLDNYLINRKMYSL